MSMDNVTAQDDLLSTPDAGGAAAPPGKAPTGVRRVNNMPLLIIGGVLVIFIILVTLVAVKRGQRATSEPEVAATSLPDSTPALDHLLAGTAAAGIIEDPDDAPSIPVARVADTDLPPLPPAQAEDGSPRANTIQDVGDTEAMRARLARLRQAMASKTSLASAAGAGKQRPPNEPLNPQAPQAASAPVNEGPAPGQPDTRLPVVADGEYGQFASTGKDKAKDRWRLDESLEAPRTRFELRAGSVIPATMISGINSELPGQIIAQVSQDVFDTATGRYRLVPQGSRLIGRYSHRVVTGQSRVLVAWQRIVFPDGKALDIGSMEGVDSAGYAGLGDQVNRHYLRMFGSAILMSGIATGLNSSTINPENDPFGSSTAPQLNQNLAREIGEVATKMIEQNLNLAPTLKIRPGYRFNVMAVKDLTFNHPYQPFDY